MDNVDYTCLIEVEPPIEENENGFVFLTQNGTQVQLPKHLVTQKNTDKVHFFIPEALSWRRTYEQC